MSFRRLAAILSLDVVGYSRMMQGGSGPLLRTLNMLYRDLVTPVVHANKGRVVKLLGDGALIEFPSAGQALEAAIAIQTRLREPDHPYHTPEPIQLRAGLDVGDVTVEGDDIFGDGVNIAARLQAAAEPGGVLASRMLCDLAGADFTDRLRGQGLRSFKGIAQPIEVLSVNFTDEAGPKTPAAFATTQEIQYCRTDDDVNLAWTAVGEGPPVVKAPNWVGHLELDWRAPGIAPVCASIAKHYRLIRFDARLNGLSDWEAEICTFDQFVDDLETVFDAARVERAPVLAISQGCAVAAAFAARRPGRVAAIVMIGGFPVGRAKRTSKKDLERALAMRQMMTAGWDDDYPSLRDLMAQIIVPRASEEARRQYAEDMRKMISPENMGRYREVIDNIDIRDLLPSVQAPCLVCHATGDRMQPVEQGRMFAKALPNARFIAYESSNHGMTKNDPEWPRLERDVLAFLAAHR
ncbi:alpha/beta fold hydrolase [Limibaculum sp. FT325]|uniref:alpha/beta fold hydrolase n=1 Tax=Thermohalobaculum sediminis TaxID=2939436 RepID=UPI0020C11E2C|nr:alpha/beta fold hydrolase [Limibaculum sediminis]MCL5779221.1 alpha/beta fold hydrolase [Limibaculum sediminis]